MISTVENVNFIANKESEPILSSEEKKVCRCGIGNSYIIWKQMREIKIG